MRDAAGQLGDRLQLLRLHELFLAAPQRVLHPLPLLHLGSQAVVDPPELGCPLLDLVLHLAARATKRLLGHADSGVFERAAKPFLHLGAPPQAELRQDAPGDGLEHHQLLVAEGPGLLVRDRDRAQHLT